MELNDHLREMLKELGQAINESISGSDRVHDSIQRIRDEGYNLYMVLDAKVGVNRREARAREGRAVRRRSSPVEPIVEKVHTGDARAAFLINVKCACARRWCVAPRGPCAAPRPPSSLRALLGRASVDSPA
jgi:hypothetical protein